MEYLKLDIFLITILFSNVLALCINLDVNDAIVKHLPEKNSHITEITETYFGYSVLLVNASLSEYWLISGAPFDTMTGLFGKQHDPSGALYQCNLNNKNNDCNLVPTALFSSDYDYNRYGLLGFNLLKVKSDNKESIISCAPRKTDKNLEFVAGMCYLVPLSLLNKPSENDAVSFKKFEATCSHASSVDMKDRQLRNCLFGFSVAQSSEKLYYAGAPYYKWGKGTIAVYDFNLRPPFDLEPPQTANNFSQGAYSIAVGQFLCSDARSECQGIAKGAPAVPTSGFNTPESMTGNGLVYIGKYVTGTEHIAIQSILHGEKFGSGFGHSILSIDLNNDKFDDLVVGAPFYFNSTSKHVLGAAYIYMNKLGVFTLDRILSPEKNQKVNSMFGMSLARLGDINQDGYQDFAVGAPFEGSGSVYIYLGSKSGLSEEPGTQYSQRIAASEISGDLRGFGYSLNGNLDVDNNGYPDLAIGAPLSDRAVILRTRPVFQLKISTFTLSKSIVDPDEDYTLDMSYSFEWNDASQSSTCPSYSKPIEIDFWIDYDKEFSEVDKRIKLKGSSKSFGSYQVLCRSTKSNIAEMRINFDLQKSNLFMDKVTPMLFSIRWKLRSPLPDPPKHSPSILSMNNYPTLDVKNNNITKIVHFTPCQTECTPVITQSVILSEIKKYSDEEYIIFIGKDEKVQVIASASNLAELINNKENEAYSVMLTVNFTKDFMHFEDNELDMLKYSDLGDYGQVKCMLANPLKPQQNSQCRFYLTIKPSLRDTLNPYLMINTTLSYIIGANKVISSNKHFRLRIKMMTDIRVTISSPGQQPYSHDHIIGITGISQENQIGSQFSIVYEIKNELPNSLITSSHFVLLWPLETVGNVREPHGKYLLYMLHPPQILSVNSSGSPHEVVCDSTALTKLINPQKIRTLPQSTTPKYVTEGDVALPDEFRLPPLDSKASVTVGRVRKKNTPVSGSKTLKCLDGTARCIALSCRLPALSKKAGAIKLLVKGRLWVYTMVEDYPNTQTVNINVTALWKPDVNFDVVARVGNNTFDVTIVAINDLPRGPTVSPNITLWVIAAVVVGVVVLILVIIILWKLKFFQRAKLLRHNRETKSRVDNYVYEGEYE